jgi:hypothetical protein
MSDELEAIRARHEACGHTIEWPNFDSFEAHNDRATLLRLLDAARRSPLKSPAPFSKEPDMPVNTNDLRDMASEFRETTFTEMVIEAANQLDSTRTERNILRAELTATREELREVKEAALSAWGLLDDPSCPVTGLDETRRARAILAAALKAPPTRAQGESS